MDADYQTPQSIYSTSLVLPTARRCRPRFGGFIVELQQVAKGSDSGMKPEDLLSNHFGDIAGLKAGCSAVSTVGSEVEQLIKALVPLGPPYGRVE